MKIMIERMRFAFHLWRKARGMTVLEAWRYPYDAKLADGDPIGMAESEMSYWDEN